RTDALHLIQQRVMPTDQLDGAAIAVVAQRADDVDRVEVAQRDVEEDDVGRDPLAGVEDLAGAGEIRRLHLEIAQRERDCGAHGIVVLDDDAAQRSPVSVHGSRLCLKSGDHHAGEYAAGPFGRLLSARRLPLKIKLGTIRTVVPATAPTRYR